MAEKLAVIAKQHGGIMRFVQVSCLGMSPSSPSRMLKAKAAAEEATLRELPVEKRSKSPKAGVFHTRTKRKDANYKTTGFTYARTNSPSPRNPVKSSLEFVKCVLCFKDFDLVGFCCQMDNGHPIEAKSSVYPH